MTTECSSRAERPRLRRLAPAISAAVLLAVGSPGLQNFRASPRDGFPLSYYPMFSADRAGTVEVVHLIGLDAGGVRVVVPARFAGSGGLNQVRRQLRRAAREASLDETCLQVARQVARLRGAPYEGLTEVVGVRARYSIARWLEGDRQPLVEEVLARAPVPR